MLDISATLSQSGNAERSEHDMRSNPTSEGFRSPDPVSFVKWLLLADISHSSCLRTHPVTQILGVNDEDMLFEVHDYRHHGSHLFPHLVKLQILRQR